MFDRAFNRLNAHCKSFAIEKGAEMIGRPVMGRCWFRRCTCCHERLVVSTIKIIARNRFQEERYSFSLCPSDQCAEKKPAKEQRRPIFFTEYVR